ncbi:MAG: hypothetical protein H7096_12860 [Flavobacterium sp.]|nr:hypothetical protein [Pedobacter sp.]
MNGHNLKISWVAAIVLLTIACQDKEVLKKEEDQKILPKMSLSSKNLLMSSIAESYTLPSKANIGNNKVKVYMAEYLTNGKNGAAGNIIYFNDRGNKHLDADFVPTLSLDVSKDISYAVDMSRPSSSLNVQVTEKAIDRAMQTWDHVKCSDLRIKKIQSSTTSTGLIPLIYGYGGSSGYVADINHGGFLPARFFDLIAPNGGNFILAVTFTIVFSDQFGNPLDSDHDNKADVAWREIYYNNSLNWNDGSDYDVESIALHESGHGLSQAHFGKAFRSGNGKLHFAPKAVMNAAYSGVQTEISKTDLGGHCSIWGSWPKN